MTEFLNLKEKIQKAKENGLVFVNYDKTVPVYDANAVYYLTSMTDEEFEFELSKKLKFLEERQFLKLIQ